MFTSQTGVHGHHFENKNFDLYSKISTSFRFYEDFMIIFVHILF